MVLSKRENQMVGKNEKTSSRRPVISTIVLSSRLDRHSETSLLALGAIQRASLLPSMASLLALIHGHLG